MTSPAQGHDFPPAYLDSYCGSQLLVATTVILTVATIFLGLRFYARTLTRASRSWDDFLLLPAWALFVALVVVCYLAFVTADAGWHVQAVALRDPHAIEKLAFFLYLLEWFYLPSCTLSRISVVLLYLRIFNNKAARIGCWLVLAFLVAYAAVTIIGAQLQCMPLQLIWDETVHGTCFNVLAYYRWTTIPNIVVDVAILCLPIRTILMLKASTKRKAGIAFVCFIGGIGLVSSCVRAYLFFALGDMIETDPTWVASPLLIQTVVETGTYLCAACLIEFRPLYKKIPTWVRKNVFSSITGSGQYGVSASKSYQNDVPLRYVGPPAARNPNSEDQGSVSGLVCSAGATSSQKVLVSSDEAYPMRMATDRPSGKGRL